MIKKKDLEDMWLFKSQTLDKSVAKQILPATGRGGVSAARDYVSANCLLSEYSKANPSYNGSFSHIKSKDDLWNGISPATRFRLKAYTPCLAERYDSLTQAEQNRLFDDSSWIFTQKMNGVRAWLILYKGEYHLYSRNYSDVDCSLLDYWNNISQETSFDGIYAIDVEVLFEPGADISEDLVSLGLATDAPLEAMVALLHTYPESAKEIQDKFKSIYQKDLISFNLIAPLYFNGKNYITRTLGEGQDVYNECVSFGQSLGLNIKPIQRCNGSREEKEIFLNTLIESGKEGCVAHNRKGFYCTSENRSKTSFIKIKRTIKTTTGLGDTIDAYIDGFIPGNPGTANEGIIGAFKVFITVADGSNEYKHHIANITNFTREQRILATFNNADGLYPQSYIGSDGETHWISMNPDFKGLVIECTGQALSSKSKRLEHARMIITRPERLPESCIYTKEFLVANTTNEGIKY